MSVATSAETAGSGDPCPRCRAPRDGAPEGLCPRCLLERVLEAGPPRRIGSYELLEKIGRGGMGVVYRARHVLVGHEVALKRIRAGELATDDEVERFVIEARAASRLQHPNIVRIYHVEEHEGRPYFTMELVRGPSLDAVAHRFAGDPRGAARLVAAVARAVHHGHDRGVLHRDLKPSNILLDEAGEPRVADFGVAKLQDEEGPTADGLAPGTPGYMAPEQAAGLDVTRAADVWSLGAVLYELLTGRRAFAGRSPHEVVRRIQEEEPVAPRDLVPGLDRDLETVCLRCLRKDPSRRYPSALELAQDLERFLRGEPVTARRIGRLARAWRWSQRHPLVAPLAAGGLLVAAGVTLAAVSVARAQEVELRRVALRTNVYAARAVAGMVLFQLRRFAEDVEAAARDPHVVEALERADCSGAGADATLEPHGAGSTFDTIALFDACGTGILRWPGGPGFLCADFSWRDYFRGARSLGERRRRHAYVGRAHRSEVDGNWKFTLAVPVYDPRGRWLGVARASFGTDSVLGPLRPLDRQDPRRMAALIGPQDVERDARDDLAPPAQIVLLHAALARGDAVTIEDDRLRDLSASARAADGGDPFTLDAEPPVLVDHGYRDPLLGGRWLAAFAPVGRTGYLVIVQTREDAAVEPGARLSRRLAAVGAAAAAVVLAVAVAVGWARRRRPGAA